MEEAFFDTPLYREFVQLDAHGRLPDESTILRFRHRLEKHKLAEQILAVVNALLSERGLLLKAGTAVDARLIPAPSSTKNKDRARDPEMHSSQKGRQWYFGMKAHIGVDADCGLVHTVRGTSGHVGDITEGNSLLHGQENLDAQGASVGQHGLGALAVAVIGSGPLGLDLDGCVAQLVVHLGAQRALQDRLLELLKDALQLGGSHRPGNELLKQLS